jgi:hypothetical protein
VTGWRLTPAHPPPPSRPAALGPSARPQAAGAAYRSTPSFGLRPSAASTQRSSPFFCSRVRLQVSSASVAALPTKPLPHELHTLSALCAMLEPALDDLPEVDRTVGPSDDGSADLTTIERAGESLSSMKVRTEGRDDMWAFLGALAGALIAAAVAFHIARTEQTDKRDQWKSEERLRRREWVQESVVNAMTFFTGGTQKRSAGIGIVEALISSGELEGELRSAVDRVLWNQLVYLCEAGDAHKTPHERDNARRLVALVSRYRGSNTIAPDFDERLSRYEKVLEL